MNKEAGQLIQDGKYAEAESLILRSGETDPFLMAWLKLKQGEKEEGLAILERQVSDATDDRAELALQSLSVIADVSVEDAVELNLAYLESEEFGDDPRFKLNLSGMYLKQKEVARAIVLVDEVLDTSVSGEDLKTGLFKLVLFLYENERPIDALEYFEKLMVKVPETRLDPGYQLQWAHIASAAGRPMEALQKLDSIQSTFPDYYQSNEGMFHLSKGAAYEALGDRDQSKMEYTALVELSKENPNFLTMAPMAEHKLKEFDQLEAMERNQRGLKTADSADGSVEEDIGSGASSPVLVVVSAIVIALLAGYVLVRRMRSSQ